MQLGLGPGHIVPYGDPAPLAKKGTEPPQFSAHSYCGQTAVCIRKALGAVIGLNLGDILLDGDPAPPFLKRHSPQFLANVRCGQTAERTKMPLGKEVGLGPGDFVFDGNPALLPQKKGHSPHPVFDPCLLWPNGWKDEDATWYGSILRPRPHCVRQGPSSPHERGTAAPSFLLMSIVVTVAHRSYC